MLQQILKDMYIDPELLAALDETQKQTLFCRMREEQVRRWRIWDQMESTKQLVAPVVKNKRGKKVQWLLNSEGEPWAWIIGKEEESKRDDEFKKQNQDNNNRLTIDEETTTKLQTTILNNVVEVPKKTDGLLQRSLSDNFGNYTKTSFQIKSNEKRGALQELSINKVQNVAKRVAEWEQRVSAEQSEKIESKKIEKEYEAVESDKEEDKLWMEQQKKANETEIRLRTIARRAREEHRRSLMEETQTEAAVGHTLRCTSSANILDFYNSISKARDKEEVIEWFRRNEIQRMAGLEDDGTVSHWFHGLITRQEAESLLNNKKKGTFLIRISERISGYVISYKADNSFKHYLIETTACNKAYQLIGSEPIIHHSTLRELVDYYSSNGITEIGEEILRHPCERGHDVTWLFRK